MYNDFFGFDRKPFNVTPDPDFIYYSEQHKEALAHMLYGVQERRGFLLVTGRVGSGKTTLCRAFLRELDDDTSTALILNSKMDPSELIETIAEDFEVDLPDDPSHKEVLDALNDFLLESFENGRNACVVVDESQNLSPEALEELRLLSNLETEKQKLLQIVLVGQPELETMLNRSELRQLKQRITVRSYLSNLGRDETREYVQHRIELAGDSDPDIKIQPMVFPKLYEATEGNPRAINLLGDRMLMAAYVQESHVIRPAYLNEAIEDLTSDVPSDVEERDSLVLRRVLSEKNTNGSSLRELTKSITRSKFTIGIAAFLVTVLAGFVLFSVNMRGSDNPTVEGPTSDEMETISTAADTTPESRKASPTGSTGNTDESAVVEVSSETIPDDQQSIESDQASNLSTITSTGTETDARSGTTEQDTTSPETDESTENSPEYLVNQSEDSTPANLLEVSSLENKESGVGFSDRLRDLSILRYVSYKIKDVETIDVDQFRLSDTDLQTVNLPDNILYDTLATQTVEIEGSRDELLRFGLPVLVEVANPERSLLYFPDSQGFWDPVSGWIKNPDSVVSASWQGTGHVLAQARFDLNELMLFQQSGERVRQFQRLLNQTGLYDIPTGPGNYGPMTRSRVEDFQRRRNLPVDGIGGPKTYLSLLRATDQSITWSDEQLRTFLREVRDSYVSNQGSAGQGSTRQWQFL